MLSGDAPLGVWLDTGSHTFCPKCGSTRVQVMRVLAVTGPAALAGTQVKFAAKEQWVYHCPGCGAEGTSEPKPGK